MRKVIVLTSGGLDSTVLLAYAVKQHGAENVIALCVYYGQKHDKEIRFAKWQANHYGVNLHFEDLSKVFSMNVDASALLRGSSKEIKHNSYAEQLNEAGGVSAISSAYVPFRNGLFLSYATTLALQLGCSLIYYGAHADDAAGSAYPDCTLDFIHFMGEAIREGSGNRVELRAPWKRMNKATVVSVGMELGVDFKYTWSCYEGGYDPCGACGTCIDRARAFAINGITDPASRGGKK